MNRRSSTVFLLFLLVLFLVGCDNKITDTSGQLRLDITGLVDLGATAKYEAWIIVDGVPESAGKFTVNNLGHMSVTTFSVDQSMLDTATACFISIEPIPDTSPTQSGHIILAGEFASATGDSTHANSAPLYIGHTLALNNNFTAATGTYILSSPTDTNTLNETAGVWFEDISSGYPLHGLTIPTLPANWKYEAWAVFINPLTSASQTISMGKFSVANQIDENSTYCGPITPPSFPGEDFVNDVALLASDITSPVMMSGKTVFITVEPVPDFSSAPFFLTILKGSIPSNAAPHLTYPMTNQAVTSSPTGRAYR